MVAMVMKVVSTFEVGTTTFAQKKQEQNPSFLLKEADISRHKKAVRVLLLPILSGS